MITKSSATFLLGLILGIALTWGTVLVAQGLGAAYGAGGGADALRAIRDQRFRASLLQTQPEPAALNPSGDRLHEVLYTAGRGDDTFLAWLGRHPSQSIDVTLQ